MRELSTVETAEISGGVYIQIGPSNGTHISGKFSDFGKTAYAYSQAFPFSGIGVFGKIYHHTMLK